MSQKRYAIPVTEATAPVRNALLRLGFKPYAYVTATGVVRYACHRFSQPESGQVLKRLRRVLGDAFTLEPFLEVEP